MTTTITFHSIFRDKYIRQLIFNRIDDDNLGGSLKGRDIIKLPRLEMISKYAMPWHFLCHYLPSDCNQILLNRRRLAITQYCCHRNATLDTLTHLVEWSTDFEFKWQYLNKTIKKQYIHFSQEILEYLIKRCMHRNHDFFENAMNIAIKTSYLSIVKMLHSTKGIKLNSGHMFLACGTSSIEVVKYIHDSGVTKCKDAMNEAAKNSLEIVKFFHDNRTEGCSENAMNVAALKGKLDIVKFLHFNRSEGCTTDAIDSASMKGHIEIVKFLQEHRSEGASTWAVDWASMSGHIDVIKYLYEHSIQGETPMMWASQNGSLDLLKYLYENQPSKSDTNVDDDDDDGDDDDDDDDIEIDREVISNGNIEMVTYLVETVKAKCTKDGLLAALEYDKLDIFYYLYDRFLSADSTIWTINNIINEAARYGHIEIIKFLHFNKTSESATTDAMDYAARFGHIEIVKFLQEHRSEGATMWAMDYAAENGDIEMVKFLHEHRSEGATTNAMDWASMNGDMEMVQFLHDNRSEGCTERALEYACIYGHVETASFLIDTRNVKCNENVLQKASNNGRYDIVKLILPQFKDKEGIESIKRVIKTMKYKSHYETKQLLIDYLNQLKSDNNQEDNNNPLKSLIGWIKSTIL
ncbi:hypothetical protein DFA_04321 [Cavenderia fasciculata]|uniref:Ankyrin repeat-containing protein n=1 Tax=Cavenderia fasciculata TaxID=261658 RepID=F4PP90_CACFS|nr:uncharacterized protein DFA_04321 [Cavenderia fasciculata]EGG22203.1 hypothetical protein DFA_04321 [Cavenderia fasciculata]|eukprot:XP_004360054.1 hypothetical protein DFA_04321 [Cavenderia fasciculata]